MNLPQDLKYMSTHEWVRLEGDIATIGITHYAIEQLGELVYIELPEAGRTINKDEATAVVESVKAASDIYAPVDGEIVAGNQAVADDPEVLSNDPYQDGWLFQIKINDSAAIDTLMTAEMYANEYGL